MLEAVLGMGVAFTFLLVLTVVARHGTRWVGALLRTKDDEIVVVLALGLAISTAGAGEHLGVSDAIGAFMIGLILASTPAARRLRQLTHPLRDGFGAIFFFHFGLTIDIGDVLAVLPQVLASGGVAAIISFHSGEDRRVKAAFREGLREGTYSEVSPDPIVADADEQRTNPRSRSAKLRWARRS